MGEQDRVAVIGAGVIGCAIACALAREGWRVLLADPEEPGVGGASFGNVGHIAAELIEPLPSVGLLFGFWRELFAFGGRSIFRGARCRGSRSGPRVSRPRRSAAAPTRSISRRWSDPRAQPGSGCCASSALRGSCAATATIRSGSARRPAGGRAPRRAG